MCRESQGEGIGLETQPLLPHPNPLPEGRGSKTHRLQNGEFGW
jgi:hypothetical protein